MSASAKKKLRKEQEAAKIQEKLLKEKKEARKQKIGTTVFTIAIIAVLVAAIAIGVVSLITTSGVIEKNTVAATVGDHKISALEASFYYNDTITSTYNNWFNMYGENMELYMMFMGLDLKKPLNEQPHPEDPNKTWADFFVDEAMNRAKSDYVLYEKAVAEGHTLTDAEKVDLDNAISSVNLMALYSGYNDVGAFMYANYGPGATMETYTEYCNRSALATSYYNAHQAALKYEIADLDAYQAGKELDYTSFSYASYYVNATDYMTGGKEENGSIVYSDEEKAAGAEAALTVANQLANNKTLENLNKAIAALPVNKDKTDASASHFEDALYPSISTTLSSWLAKDGLVNGDTTVIPMESTADGKTTVSGYYVVLFEDRNENERKLANVRHILVNFVSETASQTYTDAEKAAAKAEAEKILADLQAAGTITDEVFAAKATELTDDTGSKANGGLFSDILPVYGIYEENFTDWATDPARKPGDTGIIDTAYGYHVMYYKGDSDLSYRHYLIRQDMIEEDMNKWYSGILDPVTMTVLDTSNLNTSLILSR